MLARWLSRLAGARMDASTGWEAGGTGRRFHRWAPGIDTAHTALVASLPNLRARSREIIRRNAWAANAVETYMANAVGTGIKPMPVLDDTGAKARMQALWLDWTDDADAAGVTDFYGLQALACRAMIEAGECFLRFRPRRLEDGLAVPLQIELLEAEQLPLTLDRDEPGGRSIRSGIEFDAIGRRKAYHFLRRHPGLGVSTESVPVPASEIVHLYKPLRPGQLRGVPWLAPVLLKLHELDQYDDAALVKAKVAALFTGFVTEDLPQDAFGEDADDAETDEDGAALVSLEPGTMQKLPPGTDVKFSQPAGPGADFDPFVRHHIRAVAVGMGQTYEQVSGDLTGVNYSSIRAGVLEFRRRCEQFQHAVLVWQMCRPVWQRWLAEAVLAGALDLPGYARNSRERRRWESVRWVPQGWKWVDPLKDGKAAEAAVRNGFRSRSDVIAENGEDPEQVEQEIAADNARADRLDLRFDSDGRLRTRSGAAQPDASADAADSQN